MHYNNGANMDTDGAFPVFVDKDIIGGTPGSTQVASWAQATTEEIKNVLEFAGLSMMDPLLDTKDQMKTAIFESEAVGTSALSDEAVTSAKITDENVLFRHLGGDSVDTFNIAPSAVKTAGISDQNVTPAKLSTAARTQLKIKAKSTITDTNGTIAELSWASLQPVGTWIKVTIDGLLQADQGEQSQILIKDETLTVLSYLLTRGAGAAGTTFVNGGASKIFKVAGNGSIFVDGTFTGGAYADDLTVSYEVIPTPIELV
jgi:hypothetical protein